MKNTFLLRKLIDSDFSHVREVYQDAIKSQGHIFYSSSQIQAWSSLAFLPGILDGPLAEGNGWVSIQNKTIEAFALRYPSNRLALLYCRGRSSRRGQATALLKLIEFEAKKEGQMRLSTEASLFSYPLFLKKGWSLKSPKIITIAGIKFTTYLMSKDLI